MTCLAELPAITPVSVAAVLTVLLLLMLGALGAAYLVYVIASSGALRERLRDFCLDHLRKFLVIGMFGTIAVALLCWQNRRHGSSTRPTAASPPSTTILRSAEAGPPWPMDRGDIARCGVVGAGSGPREPQLLWASANQDESFYASPTVVGNRVYSVASRDDQARIVAFDLETGTQVWSTAPSGYRATFSTPVVHDQLLICGEGLHTTRRARLVAVDLRPGRVGAILWTFKTNGHIECTPTIAEGRVYFGAGDDGVYCLRLPPFPPEGLPSDVPVIAFHLSGRDFPDAETSLAVHQGRLYVGLGIGGNALAVLDAESGRELKRIRLAEPVFSPPACDDRFVYVGTGAADFVNTGVATSGHVVCIDQQTLEVAWSLELPGAVLSAITCIEGCLYWGCGDGRVYRLTLADRRLTSYDTRAPIAASLAVTGDTVFVVNQRGVLMALERDTLEPRFARTLGPPERYLSSPVVVGERLLVGTPTSGLMAFGAEKP